MNIASSIILLILLQFAHGFQAALAILRTAPRTLNDNIPTTTVHIAPVTSKNQLSDITLNLSSMIWNAASLSLSSGDPTGILTLWAVASSIVLPLTLIRKGYSFSIGYGYSVMAMAWLLVRTYKIPFHSIMSPSVFQHLPAAHLVLATLLYGFRLGTFLLLRNMTVPSKARQMKEYDESPNRNRSVEVKRYSRQDWIQRFLLSINVSLFYACLVSPLLYVLHSSTSSSKVNRIITQTGVLFAWLGLVVETIADAQKFIIKGKHGSHQDISSTTFVGPTDGLYRLCRHPNYLGEILFWAGIYLGGFASYRMRILPWICSTLGFVGILFIMLNATKRLDQKQMEMYSGQDKYDQWKKRVPSPLFPGIKNTIG